MILDNIEEQKEKRNVVFDLDGVIFLSAYRYKNTENIELIYADLWMRIASIEAEIWKSYGVDNVVLAMTSKKNFRHDLTDKWKADRVKDISTMNEKQLEAHTEATKLKDYVSQVKVLLNKRMASSPSYKIVVNQIAEADDTFIDLCNNQGYLGVTMDSDCINQCLSPVFNYHSKHWKWMYQGRTPEEIFKHIITDTITGGHNGDFGVPKKGKVFAKKFIKQLESYEIGFTEWIDLFETPAEALLNYRVASCEQVVNGELKLIEMTDIIKLFEEHFTSPF